MPDPAADVRSVAGAVNLNTECLELEVIQRLTMYADERTRTSRLRGSVYLSGGKLSQAALYNANGHTPQEAHSVYNAVKAAHIIAYLALKTQARSINILKAIKLVYVSDREALKRFAVPMLDEPRVSMEHGPVNSWTYNFAKGEAEDKRWSAILDDRADHMIGVKSDVTVDDLDELSDAEIEILDEVWGKFAGMDQWQVVKWTHKSENIPEWEDPGYSSNPIPLERLLRAVGIQNASEHAEFLRDRDAISRLLAELA